MQYRYSEEEDDSEEYERFHRGGTERRSRIEDDEEAGNSSTTRSGFLAPGYTEQFFVRSRSLDPSYPSSRRPTITSSSRAEARDKKLLGIRLRVEHSVHLLSDVKDITRSKLRRETDDIVGLTFALISKRTADYIFRIKVWTLESQLNHPRAVAMEAEDLSSTVLEDVLEMESSATELRSLCMKATSDDLLLGETDSTDSESEVSRDFEEDL
jgi:hypothetical protein